MYELVSGSQLFQVGNNVGDYQAKLASLHLMDLTGIPVPLQSTLKSMLNPQPSVRPNANAFTGAPYFQVCTSNASCSQLNCTRLSIAIELQELGSVHKQ